MVQVKMKRQVTVHDAETLERALRDVQGITVGLHPAAQASAHLTSIIWVMKATLKEWGREKIDRGV